MFFGPFWPRYLFGLSNWGSLVYIPATFIFVGCSYILVRSVALITLCVPSDLGNPPPFELGADTNRLIYGLLYYRLGPYGLY